MDANLLAQHISLGERRSFEAKSAGSLTQKEFAVKVCRACMAMANNRDGGYVAVGVRELEDKTLEVEGLSNEQAVSWLDSDSVSDTFAAYSDPPFQFEIDQVIIEGKIVVVISVYEFFDIPIVCKRSFSEKLQEGALYVRSRRKPESIAVSTLTDMRDLLQLATEKSIKHLLATFKNAGLPLPDSSEIAKQDRFKDEANEFLGGRK
ncbi:MAG: ATP-binding protein [Anaerolineales bacterium]|nr:MAG: ATP-binding protein [Anaerolineales bacterium]